MIHIHTSKLHKAWEDDMDWDKKEEGSGTDTTLGWDVQGWWGQGGGHLNKVLIKGTPQALQMEEHSSKETGKAKSSKVSDQKFSMDSLLYYLAYPRQDKVVTWQPLAHLEDFMEFTK